MSGGDGADLASRWLGGTVLAASDESFGDKENLLNPGPAVFEPGHYGNRGEIVDGWETRRRRTPGTDWALVRLGAPGILTSIDVDTSFFTGNYPPFCTVQGCGVEGYPGPDDLLAGDTAWVTIVQRSALRGDSHNVFPVTDPRRFTHLRLIIEPDGGVARLRAFGQVVPDPRGLESLTVDLAGQDLGGAVVASSDDFYTAAATLNRPDTARTMGEGWEARRRRDDGHDMALFRLGLAGVIRRLVVDTAHFRYNASAAFALSGSDAADQPAAAGSGWTPLLGRTRLQPDTRHVFDLAEHGPVRWVRLDAYPDGGMSRVRMLGAVDPAARREAGLRWFHALPDQQVLAVLTAAGVSAEFAVGIASSRPLPADWVAGSSWPDYPVGLPATAAERLAMFRNVLLGTTPVPG